MTCSLVSSHPSQLDSSGRFFLPVSHYKQFSALVIIPRWISGNFYIGLTGKHHKSISCVKYRASVSSVDTA